MTSQPITERPAETERRPRMRRGIRKRGILPSFGDIVLPVVSVAAVGLLVLAGRQFFINGMNTAPEITSTKAYAEAPALIAEREKEQEASLPVAETLPAADEAPKPDEETLAAAEPMPPVIVPAKTTEPEPAKKASAPAKTSAPAKKAEPAKAAAVPMDKQWRVQVGSYGSKSAAEEAAKKLKKAGYKAVVYKNPASKYVKVWVEGGPTKFYADKVVTAMKKLGYKTSFAFPPAK